MKVTTIVYTAILAVASVNASAAPVARPEATEVDDYCYQDGQPCSKLKRAAEVIAEVMAEPSVAPEVEAREVHRWCYRPGEYCSKAKRDALALAEAVAEAQATAFAESQPGKKSHFQLTVKSCCNYLCGGRSPMPRTHGKTCANIHRRSPRNPPFLFPPG